MGETKNGEGLTHGRWVQEEKVSLSSLAYNCAGIVHPVFLLLVWRLSYPLPAGSDWLIRLSRLDPILLVAQLRWERSIPAWIWLPLLVLLVTVVMGRVFCGWVCPMGGMLAVMQSGRSFLNRRRAPPANPARKGAPGSARYLWLVFLIALLLLRVSWPLLLTPYILLGHEVVRLWSLQAPWLLVAAVVLGILIFPRFWCVYICPTGLFLSAVSSLRRWHFTAGPECNHCGRCQSVCPVQAATPGGAAGEQCILCGRCIESCPTGAIRFAARGTGHWDVRAADRFPHLILPPPFPEGSSGHPGRRRPLVIPGEAGICPPAPSARSLARTGVYSPLRPLRALHQGLPQPGAAAPITDVRPGCHGYSLPGAPAGAL